MLNIHVALNRRLPSSIIVASLIVMLGAATVRGENARIRAPRDDKGNWNSTPRTLELRDTDNQAVSTMSWQDAARTLSSPKDISNAAKSSVQCSRAMFKEDACRAADVYVFKTEKKLSVGDRSGAQSDTDTRRL